MKNQTIVSRSSVEAEYRVMAAAMIEVIWLCGLLAYLGVKFTHLTRLFCDNQAALHIAVNLVFHECRKYIEIDCHFVRKHIKSHTIDTSHISTNMQLVDIFTKALGQGRFHIILSKLGIRDPHAPT
ncbi:hypothetical protein CRG98_044623 [Punica granatum]|uniref:Reverse transcriptase Ty1/copia-type domain-containing protein n=1 Tax=Punica granatum TaxID=22663 RepID=A0A2I0HTF1_PUNGR|nr:hypothetical protein CRG98_044623 [Punica granatum]